MARLTLDERIVFLKDMHFVLNLCTERPLTPAEEKGMPKGRAWDITVSRNGNGFHTKFLAGSGLKYKSPPLLDILYSLVSDASCFDDFANIDEFAKELSITAPSKAFASWESCRRAKDWLDQVLPGDDIKRLQFILEDY